MFLVQHCVRWLVGLALAVATLLTTGEATRADTWTRPNGCGCGDVLPTASWVSPQPSAFAARPFWMRPTPSYNSSWKQISVTNYQTQVINDPLSGVAVTTIQPCHTYESQARRTARCSLWEKFVNWWKARCCCLGAPSVSCAPVTCTPTRESVVSSSQPTTSPYYAPANNGRMVPVPSSVSPTSPVPANIRPQLGPVPQPSGSEGSASRISTPETEVFVRVLDTPDSSLELGPPLVAPGSRHTDAEFVGDRKHARPSLDGDPNDRTPAVRERPPELIPVSWSIPTPSHERTLPTDEVWDDTGWKSTK